jgi:hypothetical protein
MDGFTKGNFPSLELQWFYDEFHELVLNHPYPLHQPSIPFYTNFIIRCLLPWTPPYLASPHHPQDLIENCREAFAPHYVPRSRFVTYARETNPVVGQNAETLTLLLQQGTLRQADLQAVVRHFPMLGWEDKRCTGTETIEELADVIAFYLSATYEGSLTFPAIVQALSQNFQGRDVPPFPM